MASTGRSGTSSSLYLGEVARLDFGESHYSSRPVALDIAQRLPATLELTITALLLVRHASACRSACWRRCEPQSVAGLRAARVLRCSASPIAAFWFAIMLQLLFCHAAPLAAAARRASDGLTAPRRLTGFLLLDSLVAGRSDASPTPCATWCCPRSRSSLGGHGQHHPVHPRRRAGDAAEGFCAL